MSTVASLNNPTNLLFADIIGILDDGNEILMKRCKDCDYVTANHFSSKHTHSRWCASRWSFRYLHENVNGAGVRAKCIYCQIILSRPNDNEMKQHYLICLNRKPGFNRGYKKRKPGDIEYVSLDSISPMEIRAQKKRQEFMPGFRSTYILTEKQLQRFGECRECKTLVKPSSQEKHRDQCSAENEVQIVSSSPADSTTAVNARHNATQRSSTINHQKSCFICDTKLNEVFIKVSDTVTTHSKTPVQNYVIRFLNDKPSVRCESSNLLCPGCFNKINDFDLACVTAKRLHCELKLELKKTEAIYSSQKYAEEIIVEPEFIIGMPLE